MHEVHVKQVGLNERGEIEFIADFPHEKCLNVSGKLDAKNPCQWCDHRVSLHPEALASRMHGYELATPDEAFDAIVREHALTLHHTLGARHPHMAQKKGLTPQDGSQVGIQGGLHSQVKVVHGKHRLGDVLDFHRDQIAQALADRTPRVFSTDASQKRDLPEAHRALLLEEAS